MDKAIASYYKEQYGPVEDDQKLVNSLIQAASNLKRRGTIEAEDESTNPYVYKIKEKPQ